MVGSAVFHSHRQADEARASSIYVQFKDVPQILFNRESKVPANALMIRIQPDEGFSFDVMTKRPGLDLVLQPVRMNLSYNAAFGDARRPRATNGCCST